MLTVRAALKMGAMAKSNSKYYLAWQKKHFRIEKQLSALKVQESASVGKALNTLQRLDADAADAQRPAKKKEFTYEDMKQMYMTGGEHGAHGGALLMGFERVMRSRFPERYVRKPNSKKPANVKLFPNPNNNGFEMTWVCKHIGSHTAKAEDEITICGDVCQRLLDKGGEYEFYQYQKEKAAK